MSGIGPAPGPGSTRWLSREFAELFADATRCHDAPDTHEASFDVLIVGSGYGGAIAAAELAGYQGQGGALRIAVLERGREYLPGAFPSRLSELPTHLRGSFGGRQRGGEALFDIRADGDVSVVIANGLGGGSLINAGVMLEPEAAIFDAPHWPQALRNVSVLRPFYAEARKLLGAASANGQPNLIPDPLPAKAQVLRRLDPKSFDRVPVTIAMDDGDNPEGVRMRACKRCGDCATGCNHGAKASLDTQLLVRAMRESVQIYCGATVLRICRPAGRSDCWAVCVTHTDELLRRCEEGPRWLITRKLILAAGALGSTEILLRSRLASPSLALSTTLGSRFSGNGDMIAFGYDYGPHGKANAVADERESPDRRHIGPTIVGHIRPEPEAGQSPLLFEEMAVPGPLRRAAEEVITTVHGLHRLTEPDTTVHRQGYPDADAFALHRDKIRHLSVIAAMGDDGAGGHLRLRTDDTGDSDAQIDIVWPDARRHPVFDRQMRQLKTLAHERAGFGGLTIPNPVWRLLPDAMERQLEMPRGPVVTVHPLGGCPMADDAARGVVDDCGRVFDPLRAGGFHDGLVVLDGAIVPGALATNPALTIAAVALRAVRRLREDWGYVAGAARTVSPVERPRLDEPAPPTDVSTAPVSGETQLGITERLSGIVPIRDVPGLADGRWHATLTLNYRPFAAEQLFLPDVQGRMSGACLRLETQGQAASELRLLPEQVWLDLQRRGLNEGELEAAQREQAYRYVLSGTLTVYEREASRMVGRLMRTLGAWIANRGARDGWQTLSDRMRARLRREPRTPLRLGEFVGGMRALLSHAGEKRRFRYTLQIDAALGGAPVLTGAVLGHKHIVYRRPGNPWRQLTELTLTRLADRPVAESVLVLDPQYLADRGQPLLRIESQRDHVDALADLVSVAGYLLRMLLSIHLLSARKPEPARVREIRRLPGILPGLPSPEIHVVDVDRIDERPVCIRLTRYRKPLQGINARPPPILLIHGYSASGTTYAHPQLKPSLAQSLAEAGRDVWVVDLRSSAGLDTATHPWTFEQIALTDIPAAVDRVLALSGATELDVVAHCMGAVMLSMAVLSADKPPEEIAALLRGRESPLNPASPLDRYRDARRVLPRRIRRAVLSQNGPLMVMSPPNIFRGYVMSYVEALLGPLKYAFSGPLGEGPAADVLDRLLATLPYPDDELRRENNPWPWRPVDFAGTRHRMDALYGRTFSLRHFSAGVLRHIDDFFGPLNLDTVAQVIHFSQHRCITERGGHNRFVSPAALQRLWTFPTLALHGEENGLADVATLYRIDRALRDAGCCVIAKALPGFGHQDALMGRNAAQVFRHIEDFLAVPGEVQDAVSPQPNVSQESRWVARLPWLGPLQYAADSGARYVGLGASPRHMRPEWVCVLPVVKQGAAWQLDAKALATLDDPQQMLLPVPADGDWFKLALPAWACAAPLCHVALLLLYDEPAAEGDDRAADDAVGPVAAGWPADASPAMGRAIGAVMRSLASAAQILSLEQGIVVPPRASAQSLSIALGSCHYPAGIFNTFPAQASWRRLNARLDAGEMPDLLVLTGDQVYIDATAGLFDPTQLQDRYQKPYEKWLHDAEVRNVLRRMPMAALLDDHEIIDNWQPLAGQPGDADFDRNRQRRDDGVAHFLRYQRPPGGTSDDLSQTLRPNGIPMFLLDTRTQRERRAAAMTSSQLFNQAAWQRLRAWLVAPEHRELPKLIVCPSPILPRHRSALRASLAFGEQDAGAHAALNVDGWDGFPETFHALLALIARESIRHVVFLSGDEHLGLVTQAHLQCGAGEWVAVYSIHTAGLNTPYRFADGRPADLLLDDDFSFDDASGQRIRCQASTGVLRGAGFTMISLQRMADGWQLDVTFDSEDGGPSRQRRLLL